MAFTMLSSYLKCFNKAVYIVVPGQVFFFFLDPQYLMAAIICNDSLKQILKILLNSRRPFYACKGRPRVITLSVFPLEN